MTVSTSISDSPPSWHSRAYVLTGSSGSGKSTVSKMLKDLGAYVVAADDLAREAVLPGSPELNEIAKTFGNEVLNPDRTLNRKRLGEIIFSSPELRKKLESITHPRIRELAVHYFGLPQASQAPCLIYDCPLLFESGLDKKGFKKILVVHAPDEVCIKRIMQRDSVTRELAEKRLASQMPVKDKLHKADYAIDNSGSREQLKEKVEKLFAELSSRGR